MLTKIVISIVRACTRFAATTVLIALGCAIAAGFYAARHFEINTDINTLISSELDWRKRDIQFDEAFDRDRTILAVIEAPTPELTHSASAALFQKLSGDTRHFESIQPLGSGEFFEKHALLFLPASQVGRFTSQFESAAPLIEIMAGDPSLRGLTGALETALAGVKRGQVKLDSTERPFNQISQTLEDVLNKGNATFSWRELV
ncbi:MAG TPA: hopanoid biosynthesis-associated RND transporter HpnN, partial [Bradyrhizobium sp.]|nr:hopanoid biosynthesis-associated RND transporter HpnN [Bradyrhizobium sp.]